jgi:hypothetical protein
MPFPVITRILSISVFQTCTGYSTIETKEAARIGYNGFLFLKSVKTYAIPYIFSTTLLLYKLDTLLLKQKNLPVLDITGFFFRIRTQLTALVLHT